MVPSPPSMHHHDQAIAALPAKLILALHMKLIHPQARPPTKLDHIWMLPQARPRPATTSSGLLLCPSSTAMIDLKLILVPPPELILASVHHQELPPKLLWPPPMSVLYRLAHLNAAPSLLPCHPEGEIYSSIVQIWRCASCTLLCTKCCYIAMCYV